MDVLEDVAMDFTEIMRVWLENDRLGICDKNVNKWIIKHPEILVLGTSSLLFLVDLPFLRH